MISVQRLYADDTELLHLREIVRAVVTVILDERRRIWGRHAKYVEWQSKSKAFIVYWRLLTLMQEYGCVLYFWCCRASTIWKMWVVTLQSFWRWVSHAMFFRQNAYFRVVRVPVSFVSVMTSRITNTTKYTNCNSGHTRSTCKQNIRRVHENLKLAKLFHFNDTFDPTIRVMPWCNRFFSI